MKSRHLLTLFAAAAIAPATHASVYVSDWGSAQSGDSPLGEFLAEDGPQNGNTVAGIDGWVQSEPNHWTTDVCPEGCYNPLSWMGPLNSGIAGTIGTYYTTPEETSDCFWVSQTINQPLSTTRWLGMRFGIQDSTTDYPNRNDFGISVTNTSGDAIWSLKFTPASQTGDYDDWQNPTDPSTANSLWTMSVTSDLTYTPGHANPFAAVYEDGEYEMYLTFEPVGDDLGYTVHIIGGQDTEWFATGSITDASGETWDELRVGSCFGEDAGDWGDNTFSFVGIPEPASLALFGLGALGLLARRRR